MTIPPQSLYVMMDWNANEMSQCTDQELERSLIDMWAAIDEILRIVDLLPHHLFSINTDANLYTVHPRAPELIEAVVALLRSRGCNM